jgi:NAD(P)-dependent dehydrogenase (short-subunit alcohol dehydrogenase family)
MKIDLSGKIAVVTGSSAGIGWDCAAGLVAAGASVVLCGRHEEKLTTARNRLLDINKRAEVKTVACDLSTPAGCEVLVKSQPICDILVNNLGVLGAEAFF